MSAASSRLAMGRAPDRGMIEGCTAPRFRAMKATMIISVLIWTRGGFTGDSDQ